MWQGRPGTAIIMVENVSTCVTGVNSWRTAHNPPTPALLDAADRVGMLVWVRSIGTVNPQKVDPFFRQIRPILDLFLRISTNYRRIVLYCLVAIHAFVLVARGRQ